MVIYMHGKTGLLLAMQSGDVSLSLFDPGLSPFTKNPVPSHAIPHPKPDATLPSLRKKKKSKTRPPKPSLTHT